MYEPMDIVPFAPVSVGDVVARAFDRIGQEGLTAIPRAFDELQWGGIAPAGDTAQPVLIEAIFQMLEALEQNPADPQVYRLVLGLDPVIAAAAGDLLFAANFPDGRGDMSDLGDGTVLLLAAFAGAANDRARGVDITRQTRMLRPEPRFQRAAIQLFFLLQDSSDAVVQQLFAQVLDGVDHPEIWAALPIMIEHFPDLIDTIAGFTREDRAFYTELWGIIHALCVAAAGEPERGLRLLEPIATANSQSVLAQGAYFHIQLLLDPAHPGHGLGERFCATPFDVIDVIDGRSHLCCASWLPESIGDVAEDGWREVWNSDTAQSIRASILDGSFRFCNKTACPKIAGDSLPAKRDMAAGSDRWRDIIGNYRTRLATAPHRVNLAYDQTCNLSCPSCRTGKVAADAATRARFDKLQEEQILPLLRDTKLVFITGSGDPFASKNFRNLLDRLSPEDYPDLRFQVMTNGMLFTPREWARFPTLHGRVAFLRISLDAATGPTHELLRRGARWPVMEANLAFARSLRAEGLIDRLDFAFTVQVDNYREMGAAVDFAHHYGADHVGFVRLTNWGTFTPEDYAQKAVFMPSHPEHAHFVELMQDSRLRDPIAGLNDLRPFVQE